MDGFSFVLFGFIKYLSSIGYEMAETLVFKGKLIWFGLDWLLMLKSVKKVPVNIHTKFELFRCLVCPTIDINISSKPLFTVRKVQQI